MRVEFIKKYKALNKDYHDMVQLPLKEEERDYLELQLKKDKNDLIQEYSLLGLDEKIILDIINSENK